MPILVLVFIDNFLNSSLQILYSIQLLPALAAFIILIQFHFRMFRFRFPAARLDDINKNQLTKPLHYENLCAIEMLEDSV